MAFMDQFTRQNSPLLPPQMSQALQTCQGMLQAANGDVGTAVRNLAASNPDFAEVLRRNQGKTASEAFIAETGLDPRLILGRM